MVLDSRQPKETNMAQQMCHESDGGPCTTDAYLNTCGRCGGDRRRPVDQQTRYGVTQFVYLVEGEPYVGDVGDYAKAIEQSHYGDILVDNTVWTFETTSELDVRPVATRAKFVSTDYNEDDWAYLTVELEFRKNDPEAATIRLDGRA